MHKERCEFQGITAVGDTVLVRGESWSVVERRLVTHVLLAPNRPQFVSCFFVVKHGRRPGLVTRDRFISVAGVGRG